MMGREDNITMSKMREEALKDRLNERHNEREDRDYTMLTREPENISLTKKINEVEEQELVVIRIVILIMVKVHGDVEIWRQLIVGCEVDDILLGYYCDRALEPRTRKRDEGFGFLADVLDTLVVELREEKLVFVFESSAPLIRGEVQAFLFLSWLRSDDGRGFDNDSRSRGRSGRSGRRHSSRCSCM